MPRGVEFDITGKILRSHHSEDLNQVYFRPEDPIILADIYYGKVSGGTSYMPTASYILANFNTASGNVGGPYPTPKQYTLYNGIFGEYVYFCWKDLPSGLTYGYRAINLVRNVAGTKISPYGSNPYNNQQLLPTTTVVPPETLPQSENYGKINIGGVVYRIWKSGGAYNTNSIINVYSIIE